MNRSRNWGSTLSALLVAALLAACGGGSDGAGDTTTVAQNQLGQEANAPAATGNPATDGLNWFNFRRAQSGLPQLAPNSQVGVAAQGHADYLNLNNISPLSHEQVAGKPGFTGVALSDRLAAAGYRLNPPYIYGEVIAAASDGSGFALAEQLLAAIYHRFVIFEPMFKELGAGSAGNTSGFHYFTTDFTANNGYGAGLGRGKIVSYPFANQTNVPPNFFSDQESPDPVPNQNEVGYPISVHADITGNLQVQSFTLRPRGGADLPVRLLSAPADLETPLSAAAIIPLSVLSAATVYDVSFSGTVDAISVTRSWSFTTR